MTRLFFLSLLNCVFVFAFYLLAEKHVFGHSYVLEQYVALRAEIKGWAGKRTCNLIHWRVWFSSCLQFPRWWYQSCLVTSPSILPAVLLCVCVCVLRILEVARCSHVTDAGFTVLARVSWWLFLFFCLTHFPSISLPCLRISQWMLCLSVQNCHELEKMDLEECILVSKCLFQALFSCGLSRLWVRDDSTGISCP